jgi:outer membrane protein assembly factor BamB
MRRRIARALTVAFATATTAGLTLIPAAAAAPAAWPQWGQNPQHTGAVSTIGQLLNRSLADLVYDPFVTDEQKEFNGELLAHYQAPLVDGNDVYMEFKTGTYVSCSPPGSGKPFPCGPDAWNSQIWNQRKLSWVNGQLVQQWNFASDWKPEPNGPNGLGGWEPVYHAALANGFVYDPGAGGTIYKLNSQTGAVVSRINPFGTAIDPNTFVAGPLSADSVGNLYYNVLQFAATNPYGTDVLGAWLVKVAPNDSVTKASYASLVPNAPDPVDPEACVGIFSAATLPWPPAPDAVPPSRTCGSQRPGINVAPAIGPDGTIYTASRAHFISRESFVVAVNSDLTPKWAASMKGTNTGLADGCGGSAMPPTGTPGGCRAGTPPSGVDPATNQPPNGRVIDQSSSSPTVLPDGSVLYGSYTRYNFARGHLYKFSATGQFLTVYDFGWDSTPAVYSHGGTYSIVIKDNHYDAGSYCGNPTFCPVAPQGPYFITQLMADLSLEWQFKNTETQSCERTGSGGLTCKTTHPNGFEWCINAPAIDGNGVVYANSEDGNLYAINQGGTVKQRIFLKLAIGAAYTPLSIGSDGKIYTENDGHLFVVGT